MKFYTKTVILLILIITGLQAEITMPKIFGDNMVLQRDISIPVWGQASAGTVVTLELSGSPVTTVADENGHWKVLLSALPAGGPFILKIYESDTPQQAIIFQNVLIGDVWLASGQSNMELQVQEAQKAAEEIQTAVYPAIRFFKVLHSMKLEPQDDIAGGAWQVCDTGSVKTISAVAYFFARKIHREQNVPVGILQSTWGGTPVQAWTSRDMLLTSPVSRQKMLDSDSLTYADFVKDSLDLARFWEIVYTPQNNTNQTISAPDFEDSAWPKMKMPNTVSGGKIPYYEGIVWLRKTLALPEDMQQKNLMLSLGHPEMNYTLYVNGREICKNIWNAAEIHSYTIPAELLNKENIVIAVRMAFLWGGGGFNPPADSLYISNGKRSISLAGNWKYQMDLEPRLKKVYFQPKYPRILFNGMINPLVGYSLKGFLWYQGEDNEAEAFDYRTLFPMLIRDWRARWQQGDLPFLFVQLPNYRAIQREPSVSQWALLRESQAMTLALANTGMACTIDLGDANTIHPTNKQDVGYRLALLAEKQVYGRKVPASGPVFQNYEIRGNEICLTFSETGSGLAIRDNGELAGFALAGKNKKFNWAKARIDGNQVIVSCDKVKKPVAVRYAWADNPVCNLINEEGLPAPPFRTDEW